MPTAAGVPGATPHLLHSAALNLSASPPLAITSGGGALSIHVSLAAAMPAAYHPSQLCLATLSASAGADGEWRCASSSTLESSTTEGQLTRAVLRASLDGLAEAGVVVAAVLQHAVPATNRTGGGGGGGGAEAEAEAGAAGASGLGGLAFALGVCMLLCFLGMMGCGLLTTVWQLTRRAVPLSSYLSLIVPLSASEIQCLGLGSSQPAAASGANAGGEPWRGLGRTVAVTAL